MKRKMIEDKDIVPVEIEGENGRYFCDFCGDERVCVSNVRVFGALGSDGTRIKLKQGIGICYDCATQAAQILMGRKKILPDGQVDL